MEVDLIDIEDFSFSRESFLLNPIEVSQEAIRDEVESILKAKKPFKALGIDGIPNGFLRAIGPQMARVIASLAIVC